MRRLMLLFLLLMGKLVLRGDERWVLEEERQGGKKEK